MNNVGGYPPLEDAECGCAKMEDEVSETSEPDTSAAYDGPYKVTHEAIITGPGRKRKYPYVTMSVGDVFYIPFGRDGKNQWNVANSSRVYWQRKLPGRRWDIHSVSVGLRVQRVE